MSKHKHTPGPWKTKKDHIVQDGTSHPIAMVFNQFRCGEYNKSEVDSNANLIAAAPELLTELKNLFVNYRIENLSVEDNDRIATLLKSLGVI